MNLNTDKNRTSLKGVYAFYSVIITLCILALFVFNLNIYAKAVLCTFVVLCVCIMRSLKHALPIHPDNDTEMLQEVEEKGFSEAGTVKNNTESSSSTVKDGEAIDTYLSLLIETDEELSNDPSVDKSSPSYNNLLNHRIGIKLNAMSQRNNHSDKD
jgi:hypothetical protein